MSYRTFEIVTRFVYCVVLAYDLGARDGYGFAGAAATALAIETGFAIVRARRRRSDELRAYLEGNTVGGRSVRTPVRGRVVRRPSADRVFTGISRRSSRR